MMNERPLQFENLPILEGDAIFDLFKTYIKDTNPFKVNLIIGAYRDDDGKPYIFPTVREVQRQLISDPNTNHEYLDMVGLKEFRVETCKLILGSDYCERNSSRILCVQSISGTGALRIFTELVAKFFNSKTIYIPDPTWVNHISIFGAFGLRVEKYPYFDYDNSCLDIERLLTYFESVREGSIVLLHSSCHNPTGVDPTPEQWAQISRVFKRKNLYPLFDMAYQGVNTGNPEDDTVSIRQFLDMGIELAIAQTFSKNFGLYGERVGSLTFVINDPSLKKNLSSQIRKIIRHNYSNPPKFFASVVSRILSTPKLYQGWKEDLKVVSSRLRAVRANLYDALVRRGTPGNWRFLIEQNGMFSITKFKDTNRWRILVDYHTNFFFTRPN